jgi:hypothetical protein
MIDVDLENIQILSSQDIDLTQVSHVKEIESQNTYLKYGLIVSGAIIFGLLIYSLTNIDRQKRDKFSD